ncbi:23148_t:CDS:1, partial [Racocetra persica]
ETTKIRFQRTQPTEKMMSLQKKPQRTFKKNLRIFARRNTNLPKAPQKDYEESKSDDERTHRRKTMN